MDSGLNVYYKNNGGRIDEMGLGMQARRFCFVLSALKVVYVYSKNSLGNDNQGKKSRFEIKIWLKVKTKGLFMVLFCF